ncbi:MAG: (Fe-S)-binding protein [Actinomycetota bacterium]|nr:(Fe-S)-binding protein [Actinomycetota bacterium]
MTGTNRQCIYCHNFCKFCCPSFNATKDHKILETNKNYLLYLFQKKATELKQADGRSFYLCNDCRRCEQFCWDEGKQVLENNRAAKAAALKEGVAPPPVYDIKDNLEKYGNFFGQKPGSPPADREREYDVYLYAGEYAQNYEPELIRQFGGLLDSMGFSYICDPSEVSSGVLARDLGAEELSGRLMKQNYEKINKYNFRQLVALAPEDYYAFSFEYEKEGLKWGQEVLHYTQFLADNLDRIKTVSSEPVKYMYFDPCKLGRYCGLYDQPRAVLQKLLRSEGVEFFRNREQASCCGGYIRLLDEQVAMNMAMQIIDECRASGCGFLVTSCPLCLSNLKAANGSHPLRIVDIIELASNSINQKA